MIAPEVDQLSLHTGALDRLVFPLCGREFSYRQVSNPTTTWNSKIAQRNPDEPGVRRDAP